MNEVAEPRRREAPMPPWLTRALRDSAFWMALVIALMFLLALASYSPRDAGFSSTGTDGLTDNWIGRFGAWISDLFLLVFGRPAYLFPVMIGLAGWFVYRSGKLPDARRRATFLKGVNHSGIGACIEDWTCGHWAPSPAQAHQALEPVPAIPPRRCATAAPHGISEPPPHRDHTVASP